MNARRVAFVITKCILIFLFSILFFGLAINIVDIKTLPLLETLGIYIGCTLCVIGVVLTALAKDD